MVISLGFLCLLCKSFLPKKMTQGKHLTANLEHKHLKALFFVPLPYAPFINSPGSFSVTTGCRYRLQQVSKCPKRGFSFFFLWYIFFLQVSSRRLFHIVEVQNYFFVALAAQVSENLRQIWGQFLSTVLPLPASAEICGLHPPPSLPRLGANAGSLHVFKLLL